MKKNGKIVLITGGAGFIGSHVVRRFVKNHPDYLIINADKLTYAGNLENLSDIEKEKNYVFEKTDIVDKKAVCELFRKYEIDSVIHLAAESHVDRSISSPEDFIFTNIVGTVNLLNAALSNWKDNTEGKRLYLISTDEVFGSLGPEGYFTEKTPYDPRSPYSASKASADHLMRAYWHTYGLPVIISNCSNNYGPNQFPEKLIPLAINNIKNNKPVPVYGKGENIRDWLYVTDHCRAIEAIILRGKIGETYCIGGLKKGTSNLELVKKIINLMGKDESYIEYVPDRPAHDNYAVNWDKINQQLGWEPEYNLDSGLQATIDWYTQNQTWYEASKAEAEVFYKKLADYKNIHNAI